MKPISEWGPALWIAVPLIIVWLSTGFTLLLNFKTVIKLRGRWHSSMRVAFYSSWIIWWLIVEGPKFLQHIQSWLQ